MISIGIYKYLKVIQISRIANATGIPYEQLDRIPTDFFLCKMWTTIRLRRTNRRYKLSYKTFEQRL